MKRMIIFVGLIMVMLLLWIVPALAVSGNYDGIDWDFTDGVLTLGNGGTQTLVNRSSRSKGDWPWYRAGLSSYITSVETNGTLILQGSVAEMFTWCLNVESIDTEGWDTSNVTNMYYMFVCPKLKSIDVSHFDTSNVTSMNAMFSGCRSLEALDVSNFSTASLTSLAYMFQGCSSLKSLDLSMFDVSRVKNLSQVFDGCSSLTTLNVSTWDVSQVTDAHYAFHGCSNLTALDIANWRPVNLHYASHMFQDCVNLQDLDLSGWVVPDWTDGYLMFGGCANLEQIDISGFDLAQNSAVVSTDWRNFYYVFDGCSKLTDVNVSNMHFGRYRSCGIAGMFRNCASLESIDLSTWDLSGVDSSVNNLFEGCSSLKSVDLSAWNTASVIGTSNMFLDCSALETVNATGWDTSAISTMQSMFDGCSNLETILGISDWNLAMVKNMQEMFQNCTSLQRLDVSGWDTSAVTNMTDMYDGCSALSEVILGEHYVFSNVGLLPEPQRTKDGILYTNMWIKADRTAGPYTPAEMVGNYTAAKAGKWVWEPSATEYMLQFICDDPDVIGSMPSVVSVATDDFEIPANGFVMFGQMFDHWVDDDGAIYTNQSVVAGGTYEPGDIVTLTAVFVPLNTSVTMQDGEFTFSIKGNEKAFFDNVPAGTSYQVFEENLPEDWVLIAQLNTTGLVESLEDSNAIFLNKYQPDMATMQFTGRKLMDEQPAIAGSFTFELWEGNILLQTKPVIEGGFVQFDMLEYDKNDVGIHTYTIKELVGSDETVLYDGHEETIVVDVTAVEDTENNITKVDAKVTYSDGTYPNILFENWTKPGELSLKKLVDELLDGHQNDEFRFRITFKQDNGLPLEDELTYSIEP